MAPAGVLTFESGQAGLLVSPGLMVYEYTKRANLTVAPTGIAIVAELELRVKLAGSMLTSISLFALATYEFSLRGNPVLLLRVVAQGIPLVIDPSLQVIKLLPISKKLPRMFAWYVGTNWATDGAAIKNDSNGNSKFLTNDMVPPRKKRTALRQDSVAQRSTTHKNHQRNVALTIKADFRGCSNELTKADQVEAPERGLQSLRLSRRYRKSRETLIYALAPTPSSDGSPSISQCEVFTSV